MSATLATDAAGLTVDAVDKHRDESECRSWAAQQSRFDPQATPAPPAVDAMTAGRTSGRQARGSRAAAARAPKTPAERAFRAAALERAAGQAAYDQAHAACLAGRGYRLRYAEASVTPESRPWVTQ